MGELAILKRNTAVAPVEIAPDWDSPRYVSWAGRPVKYQDIVNMVNMDVARNANYLSFAKAAPLAGLASGVLAIPAMVIGAAGWGYDTYKLASRYRENKGNNAFWTEYENSIRDINEKKGAQQLAIGAMLGSNIFTGQSLPAGVIPNDTRDIGMTVGAFAKMVPLAAMGPWGFIAGSTISDGMNEAHNQIGFYGDMDRGIRDGIAVGMASGITATAFMKFFPFLVERGGGYLIDSFNKMGFLSRPAMNAALKGAEFAGWGAMHPVVDEYSRNVLGATEKSEQSVDWRTTGGMVVIGALLSGALKGKSYGNWSERVAQKKQTLQTVKETIGSRVDSFAGDDTTRKAINAARIATGERPISPAKEYKGLPDIESGVQKRLLEAESGIRPFSKTVEQIILENAGVPKKLTSPEAVEKLGGIETVLKNTLGDDISVAKAMEEISMAKRIMKQESEYELASQAFFTKRAGGIVNDVYTPDAEGVARKVRTIDSKAGKLAVVAGMIYAGDKTMETFWLTAPDAMKLAVYAADDFRMTRDRAKSIENAMNQLPDAYALNPDNYRMVYDRLMKLTGGYA